MKPISFKGLFNSFASLLFKFVVLLVLFTFLRLGFYYFNIGFFPSITSTELLNMLIGGVKFDIVALLYLNSLYILLVSLPIPLKYNFRYNVVCNWIFVITNSIGAALNLIDYAYYPFTLKRTTGTVFTQFSNEDNKSKLFVDFLFDYWYLVIVFVLIIWFLILLNKWITVQKLNRYNWKFYVGQTLILLLVSFLFVGGVRGGWAHSTRPITLSNAGDYVGRPEEMNIVLNTPFSMLKTLKAVSLKEKNYFSNDELDRLYPVFHGGQDSANFKKLNVVFLILESFGKEHIGALNKELYAGKYKGYTPFLDSLIQESFTFTRSYANGRKSIDALPSIITGIPSVGEPYVLSIYSGNKTTSIAKLLADEGYETAFFHGAPNGSMGFSAYTHLAGIKQYYGKNEYNNDKDYDGIWGIWDEPFMQFTADKMNTLQEPFFSAFFSLSSHHPFKVPEKYVGKFPKGLLPLHEPIGYSDYALKQFFAKASKAKWFKNTLFVLCADHSSVSHFPEYQTLPNSFAIPIIFYYPGGHLQGVSDKLVQQIDIMPTVLNYLNYPKRYFSFGFDAFSEDSSNFVVNNIGGSYNFFFDKYFMTHDGEKPSSLYNLSKDQFLRENILGKDKILQDSIENKLKAFIQRYNSAMINNKLVVE